MTYVAVFMAIVGGIFAPLQALPLVILATVGGIGIGIDVTRYYIRKANP